MQYKGTTAFHIKTIAARRTHYLTRIRVISIIQNDLLFSMQILCNVYKVKHVIILLTSL